MRVALAPLLAVMACSAPEAPTLRRDAIIGGQPAPEVSTVFFIDNDAGVCSATLIAPRTLLTAAHCVDHVPMFAMNPPSLSDADGGLYAVVKRRTYAEATDGGGTADLALLLLDRAPPVTPQPWAWWGPPPMEGTPVRHVGYGRSETAGPGQRRSVSTTVRSAMENRTWGMVVVTGNFGEGLCFGDSGGATLAPTSSGERLIAVHSFITAACGEGPSSSVLVYPYRRFIEGWLAEHEGPTCARDGRCVMGCAREDPDCRCGADGVCLADCGENDDPDCPGECRVDGVCSSRLTCPQGDGDCIADGLPCVSAGQCGGRACVNDPQNPIRYCSQPCGANQPCPVGMSCEATRSVCIISPRPMVPEGASCDDTVTCERGSVCAEDDSRTRRCLRTCTSQVQCLGGARCRFGSVSVCVPRSVTLDVGSSWEGPLAPVGCSSGGGALWLLGLLAFLFLRVRVQDPMVPRPEVGDPLAAARHARRTVGPQRDHLE